MNTIFYEDIDIGRIFLGGTVIADEGEMIEYAERFDPWPMHTDPDYPAKGPLGGFVASGGYAISLWYLAGHAEGAELKETAFLGGFDWQVQFTKPVRPGMVMHGRSEVIDRRLSSKPGRGHITLQSDLLDDNDDPVLRILVKGLVATRPEGND